MPVPTAEPFDYQAVTERTGQFLVLYLTMATGGAQQRLEDPAFQESASRQMAQHLQDTSQTLAEVGRLYAAFEALARRHLPLAGDPGAPAVCTGCSLHGAQVPWPCEVYSAAAKALPEGR